ncbi:MAG: DoxX family protein [Gemmatimonas sp.]
MSIATVPGEPKLLFPVLRPFYEVVEPLSWPLIRAAVGAIFLIHGIGHIPPDNFAKWSASLVTRGYFPAPEFAYFLVFIETVGAACVVLGLFTRFFASAIAIELGVMAMFEFGPNGFNWNNKGYEYALMWGLVFLAIALRGGGPYSLDRRLGKEL